MKLTPYTTIDYDYRCSDGEWKSGQPNGEVAINKMYVTTAQPDSHNKNYTVVNILNTNTYRIERKYEDFLEDLCKH